MKVKKSSWHYRMVRWLDKHNKVDTEGINTIEYQMRVCIAVVVLLWALVCAFSIGVVLACAVGLAVLVAALPLLYAFDWVPAQFDLLPIVWLLSPPFWIAVATSLVVYLGFRLFLFLLLKTPVKFSGRVVINSKWLDKVEFEG